MKCKSFVKFVPSRKKGSGEPYQKAVKIYPRYDIKLGRFTPEPDMVECDGDIEVTIESEMEGDCACSSYSVLEIKYKCKKCGAEVFPELPKDSEEISHFVTTSLRWLSEEARDIVLIQKVNQEIERQKEVEKMYEKRDVIAKKFLDSKKKKK